MDEQQILQRMHALVDEEHHLRTRRSSAVLVAQPQHERLTDLEQMLDECWDLLRRRRALRDAGMNPDDAHAAPISHVEYYLHWWG
ncbi:hypothetical protein Pth03_49040 [Planotetraspora thailandica]|uniref:DUF2630 family protein n=1 Tax=Planotetraspora thailandica TaxID=487172 RepID=A0A8J3V5N6_9ACTN|nr:DUF2630 family protein [Planotetraspora thailandica]GII56515.1 hypothetical protein Pth03_49040 [Planotetraspora thailandica]